MRIILFFISFLALSSHTLADETSLAEKMEKKKIEAKKRVSEIRNKYGFSGEPLTPQPESIYRLAHGKVSGYPALQIGTSNLKTAAFFVALPVSKTYLEAKNKCATLSPKGEWHLFAESAQYLELLAHKSLSTRQAVFSDETDNNIYAAWLRPSTKAMANEFKANNYPYIGILADGQGTSTFYYDIRDKGSKARLIAKWQFGGGEDKWLEEKQTKALQKKIQSGLTTFCQAGKISEDAPLNLDGSGTQD